MAYFTGKPHTKKNPPRNTSLQNKKIPVHSLLNTLKNDNNSYYRNEAAKDLGKFNLPHVIDALLETVRSDYKVRYQALVSLQKMKSTKALGTFIERLNDPSARIRHVSILGLGDIGTESAIQPLTTIIETNDFSRLNTGRGGGKGQRTNWGIPENVEAAKKSLEKIRERGFSPISDKTGKFPPKPHDTHYPFDDTLTGNRPIRSEDAKQHELIFIERLGKKFEENGRSLKYKNKSFLINPSNEWDTFPNRDLNVPTNRYIDVKLVERTLIVTGQKFTFKGHFYSRVRKFSNLGKDSAPIMLKEINPLLNDSINEAKQINEPIFLLIASPTGFDKKVTDSVNNETGLSFASKNLSIGLVDLGTGESFFNPHDELTKMCNPLCDLITIDEKIAKYRKFIFELLDKESAFFENVQYSLLKDQCVNRSYIDAELILKNFRDYAKERGCKIRNVPDVGQVILK